MSRDRCAFVIGDAAGAETRYCGAACKVKSSYCAEHHAVVYRGEGTPIRAPREERVIERAPKRDRKVRDLDYLMKSQCGLWRKDSWR